MSIIEVLVATLIVGIAAVGTIFMFSAGQATTAAVGQDRVALYLAQQRIEQVRSTGFGPSIESSSDPRVESSWVALDSNTYNASGPGYERQTQITSRCPSDYTKLGTDGTCPTGPVTVTEAKRVVVTVRALNPAGGNTDQQTLPVVLQLILVRR